MNKLCRICQSTETTEKIIPFYDDPEVAADFYFVTGIMVVSIDPSSPAFICKTCKKIIEIFTRFKREALKSDIFFRNESAKFEKNFWKELEKQMEQEESEPENSQLEAQEEEEAELPQEEIIANYELPECIPKPEPMETDCISEVPIVKLEPNVEKITKIQIVDIKSAPQNDEPIQQEEKSQSESENELLEMVPEPEPGPSSSSTPGKPNKVFVCKHCQKLFRIEKYMRRHILRCHSKDYVRTRDAMIKVVKRKGETTTPTKQIAIEALNSASKECKICDKKFTTPRACRHHMIVFHGADKRVFICKLCDQRYKLKETLARHMKDKHKKSLTDKNYHETDEEEEEQEIDSEIVERAKPKEKSGSLNFCFTCMQQFSSGEVYRAHMKTRHDTDNDIFVCKFCRDEFAVRSYLRRHMRVRHNGYVLKPEDVIIIQKSESKVMKKKAIRLDPKTVSEWHDRTVNSMFQHFLDDMIKPEPET